MNVSLGFIRRPIATSLLMAGVLFGGAVAYPLLPVAPLPQVDFPTIQVSATLPGGSPETMAATVAQPLERQFSQIPGVSQLTSVSGLGTSSITLQFDLDRSIDAAAQDVQAAINAAGGQLPKNLPSPPTYRKVNPADAPIMLIGARSDVLTLTQVDDAAENILGQQISRIPGVGLVSIFGQQKPSVRVQIDAAKLAALGLSFDDVRNALTFATVNQPKGSIDGPRQNFTIYANDQILQAAPYNDIVIAYRNGGAVRVRDVGQAVDGPENLRQAAWINGPNRAISLAVFKQPGANVIDTVAAVRAALPRLSASIPPTIKLEIVSDRTQTIRASVEDVQLTLVLAAALVTMVIFLFLRAFWATVIPAVAVPLSVVGTFGLMSLAGFSLDNISLMALVIAIGFVVDDAIVMIENIVRHIEAGLSPKEAAIKGAGEIGFTIVSISVSLVAVFIPLLLMGGIVGRLFHEFAITVTMAIFVSAVVSLTLTPAMCATFLKPHGSEKHGRLFRWSEAAFLWLANSYRSALEWVLRHQRVTMLTFLATLVAAGALYVWMPKGFFPNQDTGIIIGQSEAAQNVSFAEMSRLQLELAKVVARDPDIASFIFSAGATSSSPTQNAGRFFITLKPKSERKATALEIIARLRPQLATVQGAALFLQVAQDINVGGRLGRTQYQYTLQDSSLEVLNDWAPRMLEKFKSLPELQDVASDQQTSAYTATLTIDRDQAARFGITPQSIDDALYNAFGQRQVAQYFTQLNSYWVVLEALPDQQTSPAVLDKIYVKSAAGTMVPLSVFVKYTTRPVTYLSISHQGQLPAVTLSFNLAPGHSLGQAVASIQRASAELGVPATMAGTFQGTAQAFQDSLASQPMLIAAAVVVVYLILGMLYESYIHPLTILSTLPSAGLGALFTLLVCGFDLDVIGLIGIILLIGIVKKNAIMMIDFALDAERHHGLAPRDAILEACVLRFRPIMMTTMAALLGAVPLMLGGGTGAELRQPLGYAMVGGLVVSQALTLFTTPVIYLYMDRLVARLRRKPPRAAPAESAPPVPAEVK